MYFGTRRLDLVDRLGSARDQSGYYPYGEEYPTTAQDRDKFATYYRDGTSLLDYARNRYYSSTLGRFTSADPYVSSTGLGDPGSWNRYSYVENDPINFTDPQGLFLSGESGGGGNGGDTATPTSDPSLLRFVLHFSPSPGTPRAKRPPTRTELVKRANKLKKAVNVVEETDCEALSDFAAAA